MIYKTSAMLEKEKELGKPLEQAVAEALKRRGSVSGAAEELDINYWTLLRWMPKLRLALEVRVVSLEPSLQE